MTTETKVERRTNSTVWYLCLPIYAKYNMDPPQRKSFVARIKPVCESRGKTREEYGIIAKPRATMYFNGEWSSVSYDAIEDLAENGTDIIFIEKKGIAEVLCEYADNYGIALVDTQGFLTDYAKDLVEAGGDSGANVAIVSDYDASGIKLAHDAGDIPRLGVDQEMLDSFGLDRYDPTLSVPMKAAKDVITPIEDLVSDDVLEFLKYKKVEIDSVLAAVGNDRFWEYLIKKLEVYYPTRNYTRVIDPKPDPRDYFPDIIHSLENSYRRYTDVILEDEIQKVTEELEKVEGFIDDVSLKKHEIRKRYRDIVDKDNILKDLNEKLKTEIQPLLDKLEAAIKELADQKERKRKQQ